MLLPLSLSLSIFFSFNATRRPCWILFLVAFGLFFSYNLFFFSFCCFFLLSVCTLQLFSSREQMSGPNGKCINLPAFTTIDSTWMYDLITLASYSFNENNNHYMVSQNKRTLQRTMQMRAHTLTSLYRTFLYTKSNALLLLLLR